MTNEAADDSIGAPVLPAPRPPRGRLSFFEFARALRVSTIATFAQEAYECDILESKMFGRRMFVVNDPAAIKHVLIDNAGNYQKTEITRRILEPGLGRGLITSEGETWRQHRRTMSPAFDQRSIACYTPIMTGAANEPTLPRSWGAVPVATRQRCAPMLWTCWGCPIGWQAGRAPELRGARSASSIPRSTG